MTLGVEGAVGAKVNAEFQKLLYEHKRRTPFILVPIRASQKAQRPPYIYEQMREELTANSEPGFEGAKERSWKTRSCPRRCTCSSGKRHLRSWLYRRRRLRNLW